jgi:hypothetical protein
MGALGGARRPARGQAEPIDAGSPLLRRFMRGLRVVLLSGSMLGAVAAPARAEDILLSVEPLPDPGILRIATGFNYSRGDYGATDATEIVSVPFSLRYSRGPLIVGVSAPYVQLDGPGSLVEVGDVTTVAGGAVGIAGAPAPGIDVVPGAMRRDTRGFGDVVLSASYGLVLDDGLYLDLGGKLKLPTASRRKRLGTGETDLTALVDLTKDFGDVVVYGEARRRFSKIGGDSLLRDVWGFTAGFSMPVNARLGVGVDYDWQQASVRGSPPISEITGWGNVYLGDRLRLQLYGTTGFNDNSVDLAAGVGLSWRFEVD